MQSIKYIFFSLALMAMVSSCNDYLDINTDPNQPEHPGDLDLLLADITSTTSYNLVGGGNWTRYGAQWIQHIANNANAPTVATYRFNTSSCNNEWAFYSYAGVLINCKKTIEFAEEDEQWHHAGIAQVLMAHNYALLADWWGDIPFSEALGRENNITPVFDDQQAVYAGIQDLLDEAIVNLLKTPDVGVGAGDFYFNGDAAAWLKVAYGLKARYHMHLTNAPGADAQTQATLAIDAITKGMTATADEARFDYQNSPGSEAPWNQWVTKFANSMQASKYMVDKLAATNDPRLPIYADLNQDTLYVGFTSGEQSTTTLGEISSIGSYFLDADFDVPLMTYTEQLFLKAEAHLVLGETAEAEAAYEEGIRTHMSQLSGNGELNTVISQTDQDDYIAAHPLNDLEDLINQKYIASYIVGSFEAYNDYRRTGFPSDLQAAPNGDYDAIPTRMIYTDTEINNNVANVPTGVTPESKVWWDAN